MPVNDISLGINLRQNKNSKNTGFGKYYPEVDILKTLSLKGFAKHMAAHGCIYTSDIIEGVLKKITQCLPELLSQGIPVRLDPLGTFLPTCSVAEPVLNIPAMAGADPNDVVKGVHIRFLPYGVEDDNITSRRFKDEYCTLEFRNIIDTIEVTVNGKKKKMQTLKPIATAVAEWKQAHGEGGTSTGGNTGGNTGGDNGGNSGEGGNSGSQTPTVPTLTISKTGSGSSAVTVGGNAVNSGSQIAAGTEVALSVTPAEGQTPTATLNGSSVTLTESDGTYTGTFQMPDGNATLVINSGSTGGGGGVDQN